MQMGLGLLVIFEWVDTLLLLYWRTSLAAPARPLTRKMRWYSGTIVAAFIIWWLCNLIGIGAGMYTDANGVALYW